MRSVELYKEGTETQKKSQRAYHRLAACAEGGSRTHTGVTPREFESRASANSATSAHLGQSIGVFGRSVNAFLAEPRGMEYTRV